MMRPMRRIGSMTTRTATAVMIAFLLGGSPLHAGDLDGDGIDDANDNCLLVPGGDFDADGDGCGNVCDADYDNDGVVGYSDLFEFGPAFGHIGDDEKCHALPMPGCVVGLADGSFLLTHFSFAPGPSGTTAGTTACP